MDSTLFKVVQLLFLLILVGLQGCQINSEEKAEKALQVTKRNNTAAYNIQLGLGYLQKGNRPRAKKKLLKALELSPKSPEANAAMAFYMEKTGEINEAKVFYKKALALAPDSGVQLNNYGTFLCRIGSYQEAENYFLKAVNDVKYIHTSGAYENAGLCAAAIPDYEKAENYFLKALEQDPGRKQSLVELVSIQLKQSKPEKALAYLQKYHEISLNDQALLRLAAEVANKAGKADLEADYKLRLSRFSYLTNKSGVINEYNNNNG
ncbi:type IV pilus biogenesis/stability protein PilW [Legionella gresilensis]|uniref:type IV pilus biogenesis/stability protein PilW n=1 Tax=Legionella gresilensis TaxID=91823 RepID=UPI0013EF658B|nr:type IV pilus biogenesis/stability protein PilW [Legionella gresilensis]